MKNLRNLFLILTIAACSSGCAFLGGVAGGAVGTGAGYELKARQEMKKLDEDLANGTIDRKEYEIRKSQIERGSIAY